MSRQSYVRELFFVVLVLLLFAAACTPLPAATTAASQLEEPAVQRIVSVLGKGEAKAVPDQATIQLGVRTEAATAEAALTENSERMEALLDALEEAGIAPRDIQTRQFSLRPRYDYSEEGPPELVGYEVNNAVSVTVRNLEILGETLDTVVKVGGNEIGGVTFGFSDPSALLDEAREDAMADARHKALQVAELAGMELGLVVSIRESGATPPPVMVRSAPEMAAAGEVPIEPGESTVSVAVDVSYELVP